LVEDQIINQEVALGLFEGGGHSWSIAETGAQALELAASRDFDAILLDIRLPDLDGTEVAQRIRRFSSPRRADVPIIALTADVFAGAHSRYLAAGMDAVLEKPLDPEKLAQLLTDLTSGEKVRPAGDGGGPQTPTDKIVDEETLAQYWAKLGEARFDRIWALLLDMAQSDLPCLSDRQLDDETVADLAHRLAGSSSHFGFSAFVSDMREIERLVRGGGRSDAEFLIARASSIFDASQSALDAWRRQSGCL
jgi:CheY-like chemotaxis protein